MVTRRGREDNRLTPRYVERENPNDAPQYRWDKFVRQRHQRIDAPNMFDEGIRRFEKYDTFSFDPGDPFKQAPPENKVDSTKRDSTKRDSTKSKHRNSATSTHTQQVQFAEDEDDTEAIQLAKMVGLRKARFFDGCQRADKAFDEPRMPQPQSARIASPILQPLTRSRPCSSEKTLMHRSLSPPPEPRRLKAPNYGRAPLTTPLPVLNTGHSGTLHESEESWTVGESSVMNGFVNSCKHAGMNPSTTGIIRADEGKLKLVYGCMTDQRAEAILPTLRASSLDVREASLRSNGLTEMGTKTLLSALPDSVQVIDLAENDLGHNDAWCHTFRRLSSLRSLDVSDCELGDTITRTLCEALGSCLQLKSLYLNGNHLFKSAAAVASLVQASMSLEVLDLHWNHISRDSARELVRGVYENGQSAGRLRDLNLSWNPLGKEESKEKEAQSEARAVGKDVPTEATKVCRLFALVFSENPILRHLDLAKCEFTADHCTILADGLANNTTILGMHLAGNEASINSQGFIVPQKFGPIHRSSCLVLPVAALTKLQQRGSEIWEKDLGPARDEKDNETLGTVAIEPLVSNCCWVCERWQETRIAYIPGISGLDELDVWVFTSVDNFVQPIKLKKFGEALVTYIMCPPGPLQYIFQIGKDLVPSRTAPILYDLGRRLVLRRVSIPGDSEEEDLSIEVTCVNTKTVSRRDPEEAVCVCSVPRRYGEVREDHPPEQWDVQNSLFGPYDEALERRSFCEKCFDTDWRTSRITSLIEDNTDRTQVKDILRQHYAEIKVLYGSLCSVEQSQVHARKRSSVLSRESPDALEGEGQHLTFGISLNEYTHMLVQHHLLGTEELTIHDADAQFILAAAPPQSSREWAASTHKEGRLLLRHGFFELLVRIALMKFRRDLILPEKHEETRQKHKAKSASHALDILLNKHIMYPYPPMKYNFNCVQWRVDVLHTEVVETVMRKHMKEVIDPLFAAFSKKYPPRLGRFLRVEDWFEILDGMKLFPCDSEESLQNTWDRCWIWQISIMSHVDELTDPNHLLMSFPEFLEALGRLVGLLTSRKNVVVGEDAEKWDYGLSFYSPSYSFCTDKDQVMDRQMFAQLLDEFLAQGLLKQVISEKAESAR